MRLPKVDILLGEVCWRAVGVSTRKPDNLVTTGLLQLGLSLYKAVS